jgi:hypothetical protein
LAIALLGLIAVQSSADAACTGFPYTLMNNTTADAEQVMANYTYLSGCLAPLASPSFTGNVGIGAIAPTYLLQVGSSSASGIVAEFQNSSGACTFTPTASSMTPSCSSDARLKKDITDASAALPALEDMRVREFTVRATGERKTGVVAQEMLMVHAEMVHMGPDGFYKVDEPNPWTLVKAIQELKTDNDRLTEALRSRTAQIQEESAAASAVERENTALKAQMVKIELRLDAIETRVGIRNSSNAGATLHLANLGSGK